MRSTGLGESVHVQVLPKPARVSGRRRYDAQAIRRVDMLRFAQQAGFTLEEIRTLLYGFGSETPLSARWQKLARAKLVELDEQANRIERMRRALELGLQCGCLRIEDCALSPADISTATRSGTSRTTGCEC